LLLERPAPPAFVTRFQQTTPAIMAKGVEDTAFYRYARLLALCDVGGDPGRFGLDVEDFHAINAERARRFPHNLLTTMTHDAKRSADVRARIAALSWVPGEWAEHVRRWLELSQGLRSGGAPDDVERYFIFQTLLGAWPIELERIEAYVEKALREAKRNTNWIDQNTDWERAVIRFCGGLYEHDEFLADFEPFADRVAALGERISLAMVVLKLTAPGVPDIYQGDELPYRALVDPDNRRPVDFELRRRFLAELEGMGADEAWSRRETGLPKLLVVSRTLRLRAERPAAFEGEYRPLPVAGERAGHLVAFARGEEAVTLAPRLVLGLAGDWRDTFCELPPGSWREVFTGAAVEGGEQPVADLLAAFPVALLARL